MMKAIARPIRTTIVWGLIGGLIYIPLDTGIGLIVLWPADLQLTLWALLVGYGAFLTRWSSMPLRSIGVPFLLLLTAAVFVQSRSVFLFSAIAVLGWIRSGICFKKKPLVMRLAAEIGLGAVTALLLGGAVREPTPAGALGVLMFFLIQALYFVIFEQKREIEADSFEKAKMAAENILDSAEKEIII
jgi:hypothetical protein